jgi:hypothetical protein
MENGVAGFGEHIALQPCVGQQCFENQFFGKKTPYFELK